MSAALQHLAYATDARRLEPAMKTPTALSLRQSPGADRNRTTVAALCTTQLANLRLLLFLHCRPQGTNDREHRSDPWCFASWTFQTFQRGKEINTRRVHFIKITAFKGGIGRWGAALAGGERIWNSGCTTEWEEEGGGAEEWGSFTSKSQQPS